MVPNVLFKSGDITSRLTSDTTTMSDTVGINCNIFLRNFIRAIGVSVFMFALSWRMSVVTFMGLPLVIGLSKMYGLYYKVKWFGVIIFCYNAFLLACFLW